MILKGNISRSILTLHNLWSMETSHIWNTCSIKRIVEEDEEEGNVNEGSWCENGKAWIYMFILIVYRKYCCNWWKKEWFATMLGNQQVAHRTTYIRLKVCRNMLICKKLTHWGRVTHICVGNLNMIGSENGLSPSRHQAIIWTNDGILSIRPLGTNISQILIETHIFSFMKMHLKMSSEIAGHFVLASKCVNSIPQCMILIVLYTITYRAL